MSDDVCDMKGCTGKPLMCICSDCWRKQIEEIDRLRDKLADAIIERDTAVKVLKEVDE